MANSARLSRLDLPNGTRVKHSYDTLERLTQVQNERTSGASPNLASYLYSFDSVAKPNRDVSSGVTSQLGADALKQIAYRYDNVDQLTSEVATGGPANSAYSNTFAFDSMGNRTSAVRVQGANTTTTTGVPNALNQLTSLSTSINSASPQTSALSYDAGGNLTQSTSSSGAQTLYTYDDLDRLTRIENKNATGIFTSKSEFLYDYASRKAVSAEFTWTNSQWLKTSETRRVFDDLDVIQERNDQNQITAQYVRDGNIGGILARTSASGKSYFHYDGSGNVTALSDENGALVGRYSYDAFGNTLEASGARAAENPYRFSTKEHIAGMVDFGYRFYSPGMGRWLNRDPIRESGGVNLYAAMSSNPINRFDAYGLDDYSDYMDAQDEARESERRSQEANSIQSQGQPLWLRTLRGNSRPGAIRWVDEGTSASGRAVNYQSNARGARSNSSNQKSRAPALLYRNPEGRQKLCRFDGVASNGMLIDRKISIVTTPKAQAQALRQSRALSQNDLIARWEVPTQSAANRAIKMLNSLNIYNIRVQVVSE